MAETVLSAFLARAATTPDAPALHLLRAGGATHEEVLTWGGWAERALQAAAALHAAGVRPGDAVAVLAGNRMIWPVADLAILLAGARSVGVYPTSAPVQVQQQLADCGAVAVFVDDEEQLRKVQAVRAALPRLATVVSEARTDAPGVVTWREWLARGGAALAASPALRDRILADAATVRPAEVAALIYTSGSTGEPKGVCLSHQYLYASARSIQDVLALTDADSALSFLPYCHAAERVFGLYTRIIVGMSAALVEDHTRVWDAAQAFGPTLFGGLPRFFEKAYERLHALHGGSTGVERERWDRTLELGRTISRMRQSGQQVPLPVLQRWRATGEPVLKLARSVFGGRVRVATSGGAPLPAEVAEYLDALGITVLGAYGLSEHLCVAFNRPDRYRFDRVGAPMPGTELRIAEDGEVLVRRGALTFSGYHARPADTREAFTADGEWLRTGDLGQLDAQGFLRISGRKKELIALSTGKKIAPLHIEARLAEDPWIAQAMVYGEGRKFASALLCLRRPLVEEWAGTQGLVMDYAALVRHPAVQARLQGTIDHVNADLSGPERIRRYLVLDRELSPELGELTPTLKLHRPTVAERFRDLLDRLYH